MSKLIKTFEYGTTPNRYDWLKAIALLTMVIDHIGHYFFPEHDWFRVIGRIAFPIFLFLVGYSGNFKFNKFLLIAATLCTLGAAATQHPVFPLNILWSILVWRMVMDKFHNHSMTQNELVTFWIALLIFFVPLCFLLEYGTQGFMFVLLGYLIKNNRHDTQAKIFILLTIAFWLIEQPLTFEFGITYIAAFTAIVVGQVYLMWRYLPQPSAPKTEKKSRAIDKLTILLARNTLVLYVAHVFVFQLAARLLYPDRFPADHWIVWLKLF